MVDLGSKYECAECGTKFYDFGRSDKVCPKCERDPKDEENLTAALKAPAKKSAAKKAAAKKAAAKKSAAKKAAAKKKASKADEDS